MLGPFQTTKTAATFIVVHSPQRLQTWRRLKRLADYCYFRVSALLYSGFVHLSKV